MCFFFFLQSDSSDLEIVCYTVFYCKKANLVLLHFQYIVFLMTHDSFNESRPMSTNIIHWSNEWHTWLTIIGVTANRQCGCLVNSLGGKVEASPHCLSSSWEETLLLALSHPDISLCSNPHNRSQHSGQDSLIHTLMCPCTHQLLESNGNPNRQWHHVTMRFVLVIQPWFQKSWDAANKNGMWLFDLSLLKTAQRE